jgi:tRNA nucleotidyltransferase (CCA-adding enzyme)
MAQATKTLHDVMTTTVVSVAPNSLIEEALDLMLRHGISGLPVVETDGRLVGIISEFDALMLVGQSPEELWPVEPVAYHMTTDVKYVNHDATLAQVVNIFETTPVRRLPVVKDGRLMGIVSRRDLIRLLRQERRDCLPMFDNGQPAKQMLER